MDYVLVTGTSTGIGAATALHLAENGFYVFAGVRSAKDGEVVRAQAPEAVTPVILDVTDESATSAAAATVAESRSSQARPCPGRHAVDDGQGAELRRRFVVRGSKRCLHVASPPSRNLVPNLVPISAHLTASKRVGAERKPRPRP